MRLIAIALIGSAAWCQTAPRPDGLYAVFQTSLGNFTARLLEKETPATVENFVGLATGTKAWLDPQTRKMVKKPFYNGVVFHRVIAGEMIQAGDPTGTGRHNCGFTIRDEFLPGVRFDRPGKLAMANSGNPDSGGCQFFITEGIMSQWNGKYAIFGQVVEGNEVIAKISRVRTRDERPVEPVKLIAVTIERQGPEPKSRKK